MSKDFKGIYAVTVTPFDADGNFKTDVAKAHVDWLAANGVAGICLLGATGEYQSVTLEEHKIYVREMVPYLKSKGLSVIVGVSRERPDDVVELMKNVKEAGGDAAMALPPFYCNPDQNEIYAYYKYLDENVDLPFVVYNNPGSAGVDISRETLREIFKLKHVRLIKESTGSVQRSTEAVIDAPADLSVICGCDTLALESFAVGVDGWVCMAANFAPKDCVELYKAVRLEKNIEKGMEIYKRLLPALNVLETFPKPVQAMKFVVKKYRGFDVGYVRRPRVELSDEEKAFVDKAMNVASLN